MSVEIIDKDNITREQLAISIFTSKSQERIMESIHNIKTCPICLDDMDSDYLMLNCGHFSCYVCAMDYYEEFEEKKQDEVPDFLELFDIPESPYKKHRCHTCKKLIQRVIGVPGEFQLELGYLTSIDNVVITVVALADTKINEYTRNTRIFFVKDIDGVDDDTMVSCITSKGIVFLKQGRHYKLKKKKKEKYYHTIMYNTDRDKITNRKHAENGTDIIKYPSGSVSVITNYKNNVIDGIQEFYDLDSTLIMRRRFKNGRLNGEYERFNNGVLTEIERYSDGVLNGVSVSYINGAKNNERLYNKGDLVILKHYKKDSTLGTLISYYEDEIWKYTCFEIGRRNEYIYAGNHNLMCSLINKEKQVLTAYGLDHTYLKK